MSIEQRLCWGAGYKSGISSLPERAYVDRYPWSAALIGPWAESLQGGIGLQGKRISVVEMRSGQEGLPGRRMPEANMWRWECARSTWAGSEEESFTFGLCHLHALI